MALPGLGETDGEKAAKPFNLGNSEPIHPGTPGIESVSGDPLDSMERYSIAQSGFFDCMKLDQLGGDGAKLPPALTPKIGLKFPVFDARLDPKYGVRNYIRTVAKFYEEIDVGFAKLLPKIAMRHDPLKSAIPLVKMFSEAHVFDFRVNYSKKVNRKQVYVRSIEPVVAKTFVAKIDLESFELSSSYEEDILTLVQREVIFGKRVDEIMWSLQPVAFTYHAMLRLWERGECTGLTFHIAMAEAFKRLRGVSALVELCYLMNGEVGLPNYLAVPFIDGFFVASRRETIVHTDDARWGGMRDGAGGRLLHSQEPDHFLWEKYLNNEGQEYTTSHGWFASTYMGANDLSGWERSLAAKKFDELLDGLDLDRIARARVWALRPPHDPSISSYNLEVPDPKVVLKLQREMLPRSDPPDERIHFIKF